MEEEYAGYKNLAEFVSKFIESDYILKLLDISFNSNNILLVMEENQLNKEELLNKLKSTSHTGIVTARTVLVSKNLGVLCRINWVIDFNSIDLKVAFDENRIFSTRDMKFIMDKEILDGMLKLYKPNISDIF